MMLARIRCFYHVRKPRVISENDKSFHAYKLSMRQARRQVHIEAKDYQNKIEDDYLNRHQEQIKKRHFDNQCTFRGQVFSSAFKLFKDQERWREKDDEFTSKQNKFLHDEDIKRINRRRILKIMEHESSSFWFNADNVETRLKEESIFPEYIASTEYYYKLFAEALAYELGDFEELHQVTSNEDIIKQKNKFLIPLYLQLRSQIAEYKRDEVKQQTQKHSLTVERIKNNNQYSNQESEKLIAKENQKLNAKLKEIEQKNLTAEGKLKLFKKKVVDLVSIFRVWKEYTNILSLTSAQIIKNQYDIKKESSIERTQKQVLGSLKSKKDEAFLGSIEEDTEEIEISFQDYLNKINQDRKETQVNATESSSMEELDYLLKSAEETPAQEGLGINLDSKEPLDLGGFLNSTPEDVVKKAHQATESLISEVNPEFLNVKETTSSVEALKEHFRNDPEFVTILNQLGEIDVRYPRLFETIWSSIQG